MPSLLEYRKPDGRNVLPTSPAHDATTHNGTAHDGATYDGTIPTGMEWRRQCSEANPSKLETASVFFRVKILRLE